MGMMRPHAGERSENHRGERSADSKVQHVLGRHAARREDEDEQGHHHNAAADAEESRGEADQRADAEIGEPLHQERSRCAASSAKPAPALACVTNFGSALMRPAKRRTFATPIEFAKKPNIGASFGESPT